MPVIFDDQGGVIGIVPELRRNRLADLEKNLNPGNLNFVDRYLRPDSYPEINNQDGSFSTHKMAAEIDDKTGLWYAFPTIVQQKDGSLKQFKNNYAAMDYAIATGEYIKFDDKAAALNFANGGYKLNWGRLNKKAPNGATSLSDLLKQGN